MINNMSQWFLTCLMLATLVTTEKANSCSKIVHIAKAEQTDESGLKCWDTIKVQLCGGRCDTSEISDWEFPYKKSYHPVCVYGSRHKLVALLRNCDPGVAPGTEIFRYIAAEDCRCKVCSSQKTNCEWLPPNSTILQGIEKTNKLSEY